MNMRWKRWLCGVAVALGIAQTASVAGFEKLSKVGDDVLAVCNPSNSPFNTSCKVTSLPGESGYSLVAARSAPLIYNDVTIGTVYEKVWRNGPQPKLYIFGTRVEMNANQWNSGGAAFNVNDLFRQALPPASATPC